MTAQGRAARRNDSSKESKWLFREALCFLKSGSLPPMSKLLTNFNILSTYKKLSSIQSFPLKMKKNEYYHI